MSGTEGSADPAESGADTTSDGLLPGSSNQVGLASYFARPSTNPIQTHAEIEAEFQTVLDGNQTENVSFPGGVNMDFEHGSAPTSTLEGDAVVILDGVLDGDQTENTDFTSTTSEGVITGVNMDYNSFTFDLEVTRDEFRAVLSEPNTENVDFPGVSLDYATAPSLTDGGRSIEMFDASEGLFLAHAPNTASPGGTPGAAVNFDLGSAPLKPLEPGADLVPYPADPAATSAEIASRDYTTPGSRGRLLES